jgi:hypothetical protein
LTGIQDHDDFETRLGNGDTRPDLGRYRVENAAGHDVARIVVAVKRKG